MDVNEILSVFSWFRNDELEVLFIPALADPADVGELFRIHADGLSSKHYVIAVNVLMYKRMQRGDVFVLKFQEALCINVTVIPIEMKPIDLSILL